MTTYIDETVHLRKYLTGIIGNSPFGIITLSAKHEIGIINADAVKLLGFTESSPNNLIDVYYKDAFSNIPELMETFDEIIHNRSLFELDLTSITIEPYTINIRIRELFNGSLVILEDITERRLAEQERLSMEVQLRQAHKLEAVGQLAAGIAHEINTPTQFVNDNMHFLQDVFADYDRLFADYEQLIDAAASGTIPNELVTEIKELVEDIDVDYLKQEIPQAIKQSLDGLERISKIVQAMKEFSHPGATEKKPTDLNRAIETTIDVSRNEWKYSAELVTELDPALPQVPVLPGEFNQVILNMIVNAAHAITDAVGNSGKMGEIHITTRQDGEWAEITISDTGKGIPEEIQKRIFDPFFTTKEVGKGSGQGLAISWSVIVDKHGGTIEVESEEGKGTTFIIRLPIMQDKVEKES